MHSVLLKAQLYHITLAVTCFRPR